MVWITHFVHVDKKDEKEGCVDDVKKKLGENEEFYFVGDFEISLDDAAHFYFGVMER